METTESRGLEGNMTMIVYVNVRNVPTDVGTARLGNASGTNTREFKCFSHKHRLENYTSEDLIVIRLALCHDDMKTTP